MSVHFDADEFIDGLEYLESEIANEGFRAWKRALNDAAKASTQAGYKNKTGELTASRSVVATASAPLAWSGEIAWSANHAKWVNDGTDPHLITPKTGTCLRWYVHGKPVFASWVYHPGTKKAGFREVAGFHFMLDAEAKIQTAIDSAIASHD